MHKFDDPNLLYIILSVGIYSLACSHFVFDTTTYGAEAKLETCLAFVLFSAVSSVAIVYVWM